MTRPVPEAFAGSTFTIALARIVVRMVQQAALALKNRRQVATLAQLDDRLLKDIGLTRSDVVAALSASLHHDPSQHLVDVTGHGQSRFNPGSSRPSLGLTTQGMDRVRRDAAAVTSSNPKPAAC